MTILVFQWFALWALDEAVADSTPSRIILGKLFEIGSGLDVTVR